MQENLNISVSPHVVKGESIHRIMWSVFIALIPAGIAGVVIFGIRALYVIIIAVASALLTEYLIQKIRKSPSTIGDGSAAVAGLLLAYNLGSNVPFWIPVVGSFFAIAIAKYAFGGLGKNVFNPALAARAFLFIAWPQYMSVFAKPFTYDATTAATPRMLLKEGLASSIGEMNLTYLDLFLGDKGGCLGEVCIVALLIGAIFLLYKGYISWHIPVSFIATTALFSWVFSKNGLLTGDILFSIMSGGLVLGAFFMATDYVTSPLTRKGQVVFGVGCGLLTFLIRRWGAYPEGVCFSILIMNAVVPLIDRYMSPKILGEVRLKK